MYIAFTEVRVCCNIDGRSGCGEWTTNVSLAKEILANGNEEYGDGTHWIEYR